MSAFLRALPLILRYEAGYVDDPSDPGGATNRGITQAVYDDWSRENALQPRPVREILEHEVEAIYYERYWKAGGCGEMPECVGIVHFDCCVNCGVDAANRILQRAAGVPDDGIVGPVTLAAVRQIEKELLVNEMLWERIAYCRKITSDESNALIQLASAIRDGHWQDARELVDKAEGLKFLRWWIHRVLELRKEV